MTIQGLSTMNKRDRESTQLRGMSLLTKLTVLFLAAVLTSVFLISFVSYRFSSNSIKEETFARLRAIAVLKVTEIEKYITERKRDLRAIAESNDVESAFNKLKKYHDSSGATPDTSYDISTPEYQKIYRAIDPFFRKYTDIYQYDDLSFVCYDDGHVMYTTAREVDLGTNLVTGPFQKTGLGQLWQRIKIEKQIVITDFQFYPPKNEMAMFIGMPIQNSEGKNFAIVVIQLTMDRVNKIMTGGRIGLGKTGETYLVGHDHLMKSASRFEKESKSVKRKIDTVGTRNALEKHPHHNRDRVKEGMIYKNYREVEVLGYNHYLNEPGWAVMCEIDAEEAFEPLVKLRLGMTYIGLAMLAMWTIVSVLFSRPLGSRLKILTQAATGIANGERVDLVNIRMGDEIGILADSFNQMAHNLETKEKERQLAVEKAMEHEKLVATGRMAAGVAHEINNPLAGIKNAFRLVKKSIPIDIKHYSYIPLIEKEIDRIANIVKQMFDLYRPGHEKLSELEIGKTLCDLTTMLETIAHQNEITLELQLPSDTVGAFLNKDMLWQIMFNLIKNAIEASPQKNTVKIELTTQKDRFQIEVEDNGDGIPEEIRNQIFEPFFSTKNNPSRAGLGLGLSISKSMVESMGGTIEFAPKPEKGTTVKIDLPTKSQE